MNIYSKRQRARRLNDDDAPDPVEKGDGGDEVDPDDLQLDYGGVVEKANDEEEKRERREEFAKSMGGSGGPDLDMAEVFKQDRDHPDLELDYSGIVKDHYEDAEDRRTREVAEAVVDELKQRGLGGGEDGDAAPSADDGEGVEKAGETTADLLDDVQDDLRHMKRVESLKRLAKAYYADGGDPEDTMDEVFEWYNQHSEASIKCSGGSVELVENPA
jgi:hypothetical protein